MILIAHGGASNNIPSKKALTKLLEALLSGNEILQL